MSKRIEMRILVTGVGPHVSFCETFTRVSKNSHVNDNNVYGSCYLPASGMKVVKLGRFVYVLKLRLMWGEDSESAPKRQTDAVELFVKLRNFLTIEEFEEDPQCFHLFLVDGSSQRMNEAKGLQKGSLRKVGFFLLHRCIIQKFVFPFKNFLSRVYQIH
ncbi:uncharacterized protein LOC116181738 [Photinus pyralis]|uniref:uncharacterized protein LOC116181738 n=1 Tax=Photinus pyralis TaxID=7054 RepID=UPI001266F2B1|nr:uncharacterized protein LOC116181738 [Photinus pyralis]